MVSKYKYFVDLMRPFTLLSPMVGFLSGALIAVRGFPHWSTYMGMISAVVLNAASNVINQVFDLEIDKINKPHRPLPQAKITIRAAIIFSIILYGLSIGLSFLINLQFFIIVVVTAFITYFYSSPPLRFKKRTIISNVAIAITRGLLLIVAGWSSVKSIFYLEPWCIGSIFGLYIMGAASTKDFSDIKGDKKYGVNTLPVIYGVEKTTKFICPFLIFPFLIIPLGVYLELITFYALPLTLLSLWGGYICLLILKRPEELSYEVNHISWKHMYSLLLAGQGGFAIAYLI